LDEEGFFGTGKKRNRVLLQISFVDPGDAEWKYMLKVIKRINPPESAARFFEALKRHELEDAAQERAKQKREGPVKLRAIQFLRNQKRPFDRFMHASRVDTVTPFLLSVIAEKNPPGELWEVCFEAQNEPDGRLHGPGVLVVLVVPETGKCVIAP